MARLIMWNMMSLDGYFEGQGPWSLDWFQAIWNEEAQRHSLEQLHSAAALLFGRATYQGMAAHWQSATGEIADLMNALPKIVFSRTLETASWANTQLVRDDAAPFVAKFKQQSSGNLFIFGSAKLSASLIKQGLFDEYRIGLVPIILGHGTPLFSRNLARTPLKLVEARPFVSGAVLLRYEP
jgi:dihydrofolate reductase